MILLVYLIFFMLRGTPAQPPVVAGSPVAVLRSPSTLRFSGWVGEWELNTCVQTLRTLGLSPVLTDAAHLGQSHAHLLVLANTRCMSAAEVAAVRAFHRAGGAILATYLSSYRDDHNQVVGPGNHFQLADLFGCDVYSWASGGGVCERLGSMDLGRNTAMLVRPSPGAQVLARWTNRDGHAPAEDAAVVETGRVIYVGENMFAPDNSRSGEVKRYLAGLLDRLHAHRRPAPGWDATAVEVDIPYPLDAPVPAGTGPLMRVGLDTVPSLATPLAEVDGTDLQVPKGQGWTAVSHVDVGRLTDIRYVHTLLKTPGLVGYTGRRVAFRCSGTITLKPLGRPYVVLMGRHPNGAGSIRAYRGSVSVSGGDEGLRLINVLPLESYAAGVVPNEMGPLFPTAALQAMSVIARTFGLSHRGRHEGEGFDVCNTVHCQVYGGMLSEWVSTNAAVAATDGQVVWFGGLPADTTFHACCGGVGEAVQNVWEQPPAAYLKGDVDGPAPLPDLSDETAFRNFIDHPPPSYCDTAGRFRWTASFTWNDLDSVLHQSLPVSLKSGYHDVGHIRGLTVLERSPAGRIQTLEIVGTEGRLQVHRDAIRWLWSGGTVGTGGLQSTLFYIEPGADGVVLHGGGWGHGVGMCQEGAGGMARAGLSYQAIISHYYPGTDLHPMP